MRLEVIKRHTDRYRQIAAVAARYELSFLVERIGLGKFAPGEQPVAEATKEATTWERARLALEELGGTFIKLGQVLSARRDLLPGELVDQLERLQDRVPPLPYEEIRAAIQAEFGADPEQIFASFNHEAMAAASVAQVHFAVLKSGEEVAVKVQRPGVAAQMETDFEILLGIARFLEHHIAWFKEYNIVEVVREFMQTTREEMDFVLEGHNADRFRQNFAEDPGVHIPKVYWEHTTSRVLTLERITGTPMSDLKAIAAEGFDRQAIAKHGALIYLKQILIDGFFHADPHPGNIFIEDNDHVALVDFGIVGRIDDALRDHMADLFIAVIRRDTEGIIEAILSIGIAPPDIDRRALGREVSRLLHKYYGLKLGQLQAAQIVREMMQLSRRHGIRIPADFALAVKTWAVLDGVGRQFDPAFNILETAQQFTLEVVRRRLAPGRIITNLLTDVRELQRALRGVPRRLTSLLDLLHSGRLNVKVEPSGFDKPLHQLHQMMNRLSFSIIVAAIILGSSLILQAKVGPLLHGWPILGIVGFGAASIFGFWLLVSMLRHGRM